MERVYTNYYASGHQVTLNEVPAKFSAITIENVRVIINETQKKVLASSMKKANISTVVYDATDRKVTITLDSSTPDIAYGDKLTIKIDMGDDIRDTAGSCVIEDFIESVLAFEKNSGFPATDNDGEYTIDTDYNAAHSDSYHVGTIIRVGTLPQDEYTYHVASSVDERAPEYEGQGLHYNENGYIDGVTGSLEVKEGHYYRITGIYDCYDKYGLEVMLHVFTYEELEPSTITDLVKQAMEKMAAEAGNLVMATAAEQAAALADLSSRINALNTNQNAS